VKVYKDFMVLASGQVASKVVAFLAFAWLARTLDPVGYGGVEYLAGLSLLFATLIDGGLGAIGVRRFAHEPSALPALAFQIRLARMLLAAVAAPVMAVVALTATKSPVPVSLVLLFGLALLTIPWRQEWLFQAGERLPAAAIAQFLQVGVFAALVWGVVRGPQDLVAVGWAELGAAAAMTAYCVRFHHTRVAPLRGSASMRGFGALAAEGIAVGASNVVWAMSQYAPLFLIGSLVGGSQTAWFAGATRVVGSLLVFSYVYHYSVYPAVARATARKNGDLGRLLAGSFRVTAWIGVLAALALTLLAEPLIVLALGVKMAPAAPLLQVMAWMLPVVLCSGHARWSLVAAGAQTRGLWSQSAGLTVTVVVALSLSERLGALGYAYAALAGCVAVWVVSHAFAERIGASPPPFRLLLKPVALAAAIVAAYEAFASGPWLAVAGILLYAGLAPLLERKLYDDFRKVGNAKRDLDPAGRNSRPTPL
jgi:O-antigen/teichoic acid export membrane protein